jgi:predicted DCC family thiol-disulfide oxidoreductase YuxK
MGGGDGLHRGGAMGANQGLTHLFYDGDCGLCSGAARFVARHDRDRGIRFAPLGGTAFHRWIPPGRRSGLPESLLVLTPGGALLVRSGAVIYLLGRMGPGWRVLGVLLAWIPARLRDSGYDLMARLRPPGRACARAASPQDERFVP